MAWVQDATGSCMIISSYRVHRSSDVCVVILEISVVCRAWPGRGPQSSPTRNYACSFAHIKTGWLHQIWPWLSANSWCVGNGDIILETQFSFFFMIQVILVRVKKKCGTHTACKTNLWPCEDQLRPSVRRVFNLIWAGQEPTKRGKEGRKNNKRKRDVCEQKISSPVRPVLWEYYNKYRISSSSRLISSLRLLFFFLSTGASWANLTVKPQLALTGATLAWASLKLHGYTRATITLKWGGPALPAEPLPFTSCGSKLSTTLWLAKKTTYS